MDLFSMMGGNTSEKEQEKPALEYTAQAASSVLNGEVKMILGENSLTVTALFDTVEIPYTKIIALGFTEYVVTIKTSEGIYSGEFYSLSRMGQWAQPFYDALCGAYNKAVLRSLFIKDNPLLTATGEYRYIENGTVVSGSAPIYVYENCVVTLPPDLSARRVPLCFVTGMEKGNYDLTLKLGCLLGETAGESFTYAKLGYETTPFAVAVEKQIRMLREKSLAAIKEIDPSLTAAQASQISKIMPEGTAVSIRQLTAIAPSFITSLEKKLSDTRAAESYEMLKKLCDPAQIYVGFRKNETDTDSSFGELPDLIGSGHNLSGSENPLGALTGLIGGTDTEDSEAEVPPPDPYLLWLIAPSPNGPYAAVEFAEANSATFVYRTGGDFPGFVRQLNRALEAISFKREVIRMTDAELQKPENADYLMASERTAALKFIRSSFAGRVIHSGADTWKRKLTELWN